MEKLIKLGIVHSYDSFYPETKAYLKYMTNINSNIKIEIFSNIKDADEKSDIVIYYGGYLPFYKKIKSKLIIEYHSLSTGSYPRIKNFIKRRFSAKAQAYIFLNENVKTELGFYGNSKAYYFRSMGYDDDIFNIAKNNFKKYDFVYMGSVHRYGVMEVIKNIANKGFSILVIGCNLETYTELKSIKNIFPHRKMDQKEMFELASQAKYGLNYTIDQYPFNIQDSTKLIEYCAMGLKVVTNRYKWVDFFEKDIGANFLNLEAFFRDKNIIKEFDFCNGNIQKYKWSNVIKESNIALLIEELSAKK
ncbi:hypothetical protein F939_00553 [Acinetobacter radioresistens DSM 6976 = NBRC 102413 = CIP 103788]|uniref:hypothetical protein n=1 Tax=Acinetobacter radioresistens TaxID=40216 RepID=UPI00028D3D07|nr:hypothetical protein [Acinetobacter radioresistens]ENV89872.1 hypothetical protein F939_00553 [Acinetobacter radioresistens DSM 6976 = NBRC 102413 = CIP 103788]BBL19385.1 hypothetical protein ACRAD_00560 [Acinetobacter radioresistens DSM 6976 = NBRC 102413 = CIP 103788]